jgi:hypothetical protein
MLMLCGGRSGAFVLVAMLVVAGCGSSGTAIPGNELTGHTNTNRAAAPTVTGSSATKTESTATVLSLCDDEQVTAVIDSLLKGHASCSSRRAIGVRPSVGTGYATNWGPYPPQPEQGVTPSSASVTFEHYVGTTYRSLDLTNPSSFHGTEVSASGEQCVYVSIGEFVCLPGGPNAIIMLVEDPRAASISQDEELARAVISSTRG